MFKNFKLSQCDNFLYGAYAGLAAAVTVWLHIIFQKIDISLSFVQGLNWWATIILLAVAIVSGVLWMEESIQKLAKLIEERNLNQSPEGGKFLAKWDKLDTAYCRVGWAGIILMVCACVYLIWSYCVWLKSLA